MRFARDMPAGRNMPLGHDMPFGRENTAKSKFELHTKTGAFRQGKLLFFYQIKYFRITGAMQTR